jgi:hypothetical protein
MVTRVATLRRFVLWKIAAMFPRLDDLFQPSSWKRGDPAVRELFGS